VIYEWILGVLLRPGTTFHKAQSELRFDYWWIVLCAMTLDGVVIWQSAEFRSNPSLGFGNLLITVLMISVILLDVQAVLLFGVGRLFHWAITWADALKYIGLSWAIILFESVATFYPSIKGLFATSFWVTLPFRLLYVLVLTAGVRRVSGLPLSRSLLVAAAAALPLFLLLWVHWSRL
jgi:hypothetical protein